MWNPYQQQYPTLPAQQVLQANGKASIDAIRLPPNSSVLVMDTTAPLVWLCVSDGLGNVASTPYDISPHKETPKEENSLEARIKALEERMNEYVKPYDVGTKQREAGKPVAEDSAD